MVDVREPRSSACSRGCRGANGCSIADPSKLMVETGKFLSEVSDQLLECSDPFAVCCNFLGNVYFLLSHFLVHLGLEDANDLFDSVLSLDTLLLEIAVERVGKVCLPVG